MCGFPLANSYTSAIAISYFGCASSQSQNRYVE